jgi:polyhydroxyalkanoate synthase
MVMELGDLFNGDAATRVDPIGLGGALRAAAMAAVRRPVPTAQSLIGLAMMESRVGLNTLVRVAGGKPEPVATPLAGDRRFTDPAWRENALLSGVLESYLCSTEWAKDLLASVDLDDQTRLKARFALGMIIDSLAPSNAPWLNPEVAKALIDTGGMSLVRGAWNVLDDVRHNGGWPSQVDRGAFTVGVNLAATPGRIVLRNQLIELIAYEPQTKRVYAEPILFSPPWINKYYIMDLAPGRSLVEFAVQQGFTVFMISYRNGDATMAGLTMDDYLELGLLSALDRIEELIGAPRVNLLGLCLGGTMAMLSLAYLAARNESHRVGWASLTNTLVDFADAGDLKTFTDEKTIAYIEKGMRKKGYLEASQMAGTFDWMRGNDLIWNYVISNWYMGRKAPAFDILAWNRDSTRMPATMHAQYLRACYLDNLLVTPGAFTIGGQPVDFGRVPNPLWVLGAESDHVAPWRATYRTTQVVGGEARFTLTSSGHIAGVVNPPESAKAQHWVRDDCPADADEWMTGATQTQGSWWLDWLEWAKSRSGALVAPPRLPKGEPAPGAYVRGQSGPPVPAGERNKQTNTTHSRTRVRAKGAGGAARPKRV